MPEDVKKEAEEKEREEEEETEELLDMYGISKTEVSELTVILSKNPKIEQQVREILDYHLKGGVDRTTAETVVKSLMILLGKPASHLVVTSCTYNSSKFFNKLEKDSEGVVQDKVIPFLRHLTALYGRKMRKAVHLKGAPEDWRDIDVTLYREEEKEVWFIDVNLTKYNEENLFLKMSPESAFNLAKYLLEEMGKLPSEAVDEDVIKKFRDRTEDFKKKFLSDNGDRD